MLAANVIRSVVYRPFPTSNHNLISDVITMFELYIVRFLHQTTTNGALYICMARCISSVSYIKPQRLVSPLASGKVVYRPFPTSNHNDLSHLHRFIMLYIVRFLHQTTTYIQMLRRLLSCISSVSYIKPQQSAVLPCTCKCCISSVSYIKPQPKPFR